VEPRASFIHRQVPLLGVLAAVALPVLLTSALWWQASDAQEALPPLEQAPFPRPTQSADIDILRQSRDVAEAKSAGCVTCHQNSHDPHWDGKLDQKQSFFLGCVDCHGGDAKAADKHKAHVQPRYPEAWPTAANPVRSYTLLNHECPEFIQFVNPGDLRIAHITCGNCHANEVLQNRMSMMTHGCMLWGSALYNNGAFPLKPARFGEAYSMHGTPLRLQTWPPPTAEEMQKKGVLAYLDPLPRFEMTQPGNVLRFFERGGRFDLEIGIPERLEESGKPRARLSTRGLGTINRTDPVFVGLQRTRLLDPTLNFLGTNDHAGDYRSSGCTACHVIYANDRSSVNSGPWAKFGNRGTSQNADPTINKDQPGHPIYHRFTSGIPSSQCIVCHVHPGTNVMNSYLGYMWWDEETDAEVMYPKKQKHPSAEEFTNAAMNNPDEASARGLWSDPEFLEHVAELNPSLRHTQFADFHGHGWVFRAVFKKDRQGSFLDYKGQIVKNVDAMSMKTAVQMPEQIKELYRTPPPGEPPGASPRVAPQPYRDNLPVHLLDVHLEKGMHCADCHFVQDAHGNTKLYGEVRAAIEVQCIDCHGTIGKYANLKTTGPAAPEPGGNNLERLRTPFGKRLFEKRTDEVGRPVLVQNSMVEANLAWEVTQVKDTITPGHPKYSVRAQLAKTVRFKAGSAKAEFEWGDVPCGPDGTPDEQACAHATGNMSCMACHSSWNPSCFGCHLPQRADKKMPGLHNEGDVERNYVAYNFQTLRDDAFMLARDGNATCNRIGPARSSCAIHVGSYNQNRDSIYVQQQTISAEGFSGIAFSTNVPHTVRGGPPLGKNGLPLDQHAFLPGRNETKSCTDCHLSVNEDNNAIMAQLLMQGTGAMNFMGRYCWVASGEHGIHSVVVTEQEEPQTVIGSTLQRLAFPDDFAKHLKNNWQLEHAHEHPGIDIGEKLLHPFRKPEILQVQNRGEYLYAACGEGGLRVFDIAFIDDKSFSERVTTAPVSPFGQKFYVPTKFAAAVAAPCTPAPDPTRTHRDENSEGRVHALYGYIYVADKCEGLILVGAATTIDGDPTNNYLKREVTFNPQGILNGACAVTIVGNYAYVCADAGLVVVALDDPKQPRVTAVLGEPVVKDAHAIQVQFRYAYLCDHDGVLVLDVTDLAKPKPVTRLEMAEAHNIYLARTYAYVAAGKEGLVILDIEQPNRPRIDQVYNAKCQINDLHDVKLGITYVSQFAYLADGKNGLRIVQLTSPDTPGNQGFSPRPTPQLIATYKIPHGGHALSVARALDRDRAVDESGNQIGVFGRVGARPLTLTEQQRFFLRQGEVWRVSDNPTDRWFAKGYQPPAKN
jgi:hypothetical protein